VTLPVKPTSVPSEFILCVGFNPTATRGVFVHHDKEGSGNSLTGLPGEPGSDFTKGDWLIRASVDVLKTPAPAKGLH
jgi:RNA polymerase sigma-70 factor (ECF subfamily)